MSLLKDIKFDCKYFRGDIPCIPNKLRRKECGTCDEYTPIDKKILIIKLGAIGDVIRTTPLIVKYKELFPNCHITWLTQYPAILPANDIDKILKAGADSFFFLSHSQFDIVINLDKEAEACMLTEKISASKKYGFTWKNGHIAAATPAAEHKLLTGFFDQLSQANTKSYLQEIFEIVHQEFNYQPYLLPLHSTFNKKWNAWKQQVKGKKIIGLNTGCGQRWLTRLWPTHYWIDLINQLSKNENYYVMLLGGKDEHEQNLQYAKETGAFYPGTFSLEEFIEITRQCDLVVTAVSMMMHIATGLQKKMVLFNNIFNKHEFELYGRGIIVEPPTGCDCYYGNTCKRDRHCMKDLPVHMVLNAIQQLI